MALGSEHFESDEKNLNPVFLPFGFEKKGVWCHLKSDINVIKTNASDCATNIENNNMHSQMMGFS